VVNASNEMKKTIKGKMNSNEAFSDKSISKQVNAMGPGSFFYIVAAIVLAQALFNAFLVSWQQTGWSALQVQWANAGVLLGVSLLWFLFWWALKYSST
jgi:hypothetical protein